MNSVTLMGHHLEVIQKDLDETEEKIREKYSRLGGFLSCYLSILENIRKGTDLRVRIISGDEDYLCKRCSDDPRCFPKLAAIYEEMDKKTIKRLGFEEERVYTAKEINAKLKSLKERNR